MQSDLNNIQDLFAKMQKDGFDTNSNLKWGFFFFNRNVEGLNKVYKELDGHDYNLESLEKDDDGEWRLYVTKIEVLTAEKLHKRNLAFNELADYCEVDLYDGWDVEKINV
jgi:hypothetical protein